MQIVATVAELRAARTGLHGSVGLVPTMGALHDGHLELVRQARRDHDVVIVTIFVNPAQFGPSEDLAKYPRNLPKDLDMLREVGVDLVFTPTPEVMYPPNFQSWLEVTEVSQGLEGARRPGHFRGVATVVAKLFNLTQPHTAYFGQKDAQQVAVIKRMVRDLDFPLTIAVIPTVREADGLAMSSRNVYLTHAQRRAAIVIRRALQSVADAYAAGERQPQALRAAMLDTLHNEPLADIDYVSLADAETLREQEMPTTRPLLVSLTVRFGSTRLLDNMLLPVALNTRAALTAELGGAGSSSTAQN